MTASDDKGGEADMWRSIAKALWRNRHRCDADFFLSDAQKARCEDIFDGRGANGGRDT